MPTPNPSFTPTDCYQRKKDKVRKIEENKSGGVWVGYHGSLREKGEGNQRGEGHENLGWFYSTGTRRCADKTQRDNRGLKGGRQGEGGGETDEGAQEGPLNGEKSALEEGSRKRSEQSTTHQIMENLDCRKGSVSKGGGNERAYERERSPSYFAWSVP